MKVAVLSDIHLGAEPSVDEFGHEPAAFVQFLRVIEERHDHIVLNGDVLEGLRGKKLGRKAQRSEVFTAAIHYKDMVERLQGPQYHWLCGNHDPATAELGIPQHRRMYIDKSLLFFVHGDEFDRIQKLAPGLSPLVNWVNAWVNRWTGRDADEGLYQLEAWLLGLRDDPTADHFQRAAVCAARHEGANVVIVGHTHTGGVWSHSDVVYANSGTCSLGRREWLSIDTERQTVAFHRNRPDAPPVQITHWISEPCNL